MFINGGGGGIPDLRTKISQGKYLLYGVLIYSDTDKNFINFLKDTRDSLSVMSGGSFFLFWFEHFEKDCLYLWMPGDEPKDRRSKISRNESLRLAKALKVPMSKTPCLVICRNLDDNRAVVYSIDNSWSHTQMAEHFKSICDHVEIVLEKFRKDSEYNVRLALEKRLMASKTKKWVKDAVSNQSIGNILKAIATGAKVA